MRVRTAIIVFGMCAVTIAGCASSAHPEPTTVMPPSTLSPTAYQAALRSADTTMAPAFDRLTTAGSPEDARAALDQAATATSDAQRQLATDLSQLSSQGASMELCAMPSILASVSNTTGVNNLRTVREALGSGQPGASYQWGEFLPAPTPLPDRRLDNAQLIDSRRRTGRGQLKVDNDAEHDAVVKLVHGGTSIVSVYVSTGSSATVGQINDGSCDLFYTSGTDWDNQLKPFTRSCQFERFEQKKEFNTIAVKDGIEYTVQSISLKPTIGGNAPTEAVPAQPSPR